MVQPHKVGDSISLLRIAVANPTSLAKNALNFNSLPFDACFVSETSATGYVKNSLAKIYKKEGLHFLWGCDVPALHRCRDASESKRGSAVGVCMLFRPTITMRPTREALPEHWDKTCRILVTFMHLRGMTIRCVCLYGVQSSAPDAFAKNVSLWQAVLQIVSACDMPTLIGGDFNLRPQSMSLWSSFLDLGFGEVFEHQWNQGVQLPPTCNSKTFHDTIVFSKHFAASLCEVEVNQSKIFPNHDPLVVGFNISKSSFIYKTLVMPSPLQDDVLCSDVFQHCQSKAFDFDLNLPRSDMTKELSHEIATKSFGCIGDAFENAFCEAVKIHECFHGAPPGAEHESKGFFSLPQKDQMNRLKPRSPKVLKVRSGPKKGRSGVYEPPGETYSIRVSRIVKQIRRLQSLLVRLKKYTEDHLPVHIKSQNAKEWHVIKNAYGIGKTFREYVMFELLILIWYDDNPPVEWLENLCASLKMHVDCLVKKESQCRRKQFQHDVTLDTLYFGSSLCHAMIKNKKQEVVHCFEVIHKQDVKRIRVMNKGLPKLKVENADELQQHVPLVDNQTGCEMVISSILADDVIEVDQLPCDNGASFTVVQKQFQSDPQLIQKAFFEFWAPFWLRDDEYHLESPSAWKDFLDMLNLCPSLCEDDLSHKHSVAEWKHAIATTKTKTSRGICGFSQPELKVMHDKGIQAIIDICDSLYHCGLPAWFMIAKVILLPKFATATCIPDMRPITIFSLIFRTWAKVTARRLLNKWSLTIPSCVVGALPKRSCTQLSLKNAVRIERELSIGAGDVGGFYLDICKCFNAFGRLPVILAMRKCGFPESMACFWKSSLNQMSRTLMALGSFSCPEKATTGLPEGDPLSVCGMAVIGFCWSHLLKCINVIVSVYADDWSWMGTHPRQHILAIRLTQDFLQSLKLHADPSKIWVWGSSPEARKQWSKISLEITGNPRSYRVATAEKELGIYLHYTKQNGLGCQLDRLEEGFKRLRKLRTLPVSIQKKASLIQTNVWPCALFGTDATYLGQKKFARLRSLLTEAIVPKTKYTNCYLASCVMSDSLMDPLVYVIVRTLKLWRRMLLTDIEDNDMLRHILSEAVADPQRAFGPATTLCSYLEKINWSISPQGKCVDQNGFIFDLIEVSNTYITNRVRDAWNFVVSQSIETRSDFENWPVPMCQFTFDDRNFIDSRTAAIVAIHQTMGQEFGDKTRSWVGGTKQETYTCPLCDGCDNRQHFLLECSHLQTLRDENWRLLKRLKDDFPHMLFLPILYQHPQQSLATAICDHRLLPDPFAMDFNGVDISEGRTFFTDGSCIFPHLPCARMAGFSVVVDLAESHQDRINAVHMVSEGSPPSLLQPVCAGLQCGEQTINRAELSALIQVTLSVHAATIFTDSSYACNVYKEVQEQPHPMYHHMKENFDLLIILCRCFLEGKNPNNFSVKKILAHQNVDEVTDPLQRYQVFGNMLADKMAKSVLKEDRSDFHRLMWKLGRFYSRQKQLLRQLLKVVTHVDILRQDAFDKRKTTELRRQLAYAPDLAQWRVSDGLRVFPTTISDEVLSAFIPGASVLISILQWASQLRWPTEATDACLGISHFELTINCLLYTKKPFPFVLTKRGKYMEYRDSLLHEDASLLPHSVWDDVRILEHSITFLKNFLQFHIFPHEHQARRRYLGVFGCKKTLQGYRLRPQLLNQEKHVQVMQTVVDGEKLHSVSSFEGCVGEERKIHDLDHLEFHERYRVYKRLEKRRS